MKCAVIVLFCLATLALATPQRPRTYRVLRNSQLFKRSLHTRQRSIDYLPPLEQTLPNDPSYIPPQEPETEAPNDYLPPVAEEVPQLPLEHLPAEVGRSSSSSTLAQAEGDTSCIEAMVVIDGVSEIVRSGDCEVRAEHQPEPQQQSVQVESEPAVQPDELPSYDENGYLYPKPSRAFEIPFARTIDQEIPTEDEYVFTTTAAPEAAATTAAPEQVSTSETPQESQRRRRAGYRLQRDLKLVRQTRQNGPVPIRTPGFNGRNPPRAMTLPARFPRPRQ